MFRREQIREITLNRLRRFNQRAVQRHPEFIQSGLPQHRCGKFPTKPPYSTRPAAATLASLQIKYDSHVKTLPSLSFAFPPAPTAPLGHVLTTMSLPASLREVQFL